MTARHGTKSCVDCNAIFAKSKNDRTVRCPACRAQRAGNAGHPRDGFTYDHRGVRVDGFAPIACGQCGHVHTTIKCDRCGF